jgi:pimeloyl-CoA synthetase
MALKKYIYTETLYITVEVYAEDIDDATDTAGGYIGSILAHEEAEARNHKGVRSVEFDSQDCKSRTEEDFEKGI